MYGCFIFSFILHRAFTALLFDLVYEYLSRPGTTNRDAALVLSCLLMALALLAFVLIEWAAPAFGDSSTRSTTGPRAKEPIHA